MMRREELEMKERDFEKGYKEEMIRIQQKKNYFQGLLIQEKELETARAPNELVA